MKKLIIVSNRLPVQFDKGSGELKESSGGLVSALKSVKFEDNTYWVGAIQGGTSEEQLQTIAEEDGHDFHYRPVRVPTKLYEKYYNGFSNDVLWPLFHYEVEMVQYTDELWESYQEVNRLFAEEILQIAEEGDTVWVHDFHFFMLPQYLKEMCSCRVGFFLHIPFPSSEVYRQLPVRKEILNSLTKCDLIGFHDYSYVQHFANSLHRILGLPHGSMSVKIDSRELKLGVYPVSIDSQFFASKSVGLDTLNYFDQFYSGKGNKKIILGVDRLDYIKGIDLKLKSFQKLLEKYPEQREKVQFFQIVVPSRMDVPHYQELKDDLDKLVGEINGAYSTPNYTPVCYIFNSVNINQLTALYRGADVLFVGSKRDGMNLVCLEYIMCQDPENPGVVLLSEFAGATSTLAHAKLINPWDIEATAEQINMALKEDLGLRKQDHASIVEFLNSYTATDWAKSFIHDLENGVTENTSATLIDPSILQKLKGQLGEGKKITIFLDYDGTLAPISDHPDDVRMNPEMERVISKLTGDPRYQVIIISGRDQKYLAKYLAHFNVPIVCEHGAKMYNPKTKRWKTLVVGKKNLWYEQAKKILMDYQIRTPGSFLEEKEYSLAWHYRKTPETFGDFQSLKLMVELEQSMTSLPVHIIHGKKVIEVKAIEANKGSFCEFYKNNIEASEESGGRLYVAIGDDKTDEQMFSSLNTAEDITIKVGTAMTCALYRVNDQSEVRSLLNDLFSA